MNKLKLKPTQLNELNKDENLSQEAKLYIDKLRLDYLNNRTNLETLKFFIV